VTALRDELSAAHLEHLQRTATKASNTIAARARVLRAVGNAGVATREELEAWWETRAGLSPATRASDLAHLRSFYKWCAIWEYRLDDPTVRIEAPRVANGLPRPITTHDLQTLHEQLPGDLWRAAALGAYAGLRISETASLDWSDVDAEAMLLRIRESKGQKSRVVRVSPLLLDMLLPSTGGNVVTAGGEEPSPATLQRRLNRAIKACGVEATTHQLRHRFGSKAYQATGDLVTLARMMGHSSTRTTEVYAAGSSEAEAKIAAAVMR
jgi:integrase